MLTALSVCHMLKYCQTESRYFQTSAEDMYLCEILMPKCIKRIRDLFEYALYKFTLYSLTLLTNRLQYADFQYCSLLSLYNKVAISQKLYKIQDVSL